jgi:hypothetical protein
VVVAVFFSHLFARQITLSLRRLVSFTERVGADEQEESIHLAAEDELTELRASLSEMTRRLGEAHREIPGDDRMPRREQPRVEEADEDSPPSRAPRTPGSDDEEQSDDTEGSSPAADEELSNPESWAA